MISKVRCLDKRENADRIKRTEELLKRAKAARRG
jgi:hypothetical protein